MASIALIDSDVLIDASRRDSTALSALARLEQSGSLTISAISRMELIAGCQDKRELRAVDRFVARFQVIKLSEPISDMAVRLMVRYRLSHGLAMPDALIAATALVMNLRLMTRNRRDYEFIDGLTLDPYPEA